MRFSVRIGAAPVGPTGTNAGVIESASANEIDLQMSVHRIGPRWMKSEGGPRKGRRRLVVIATEFYNGSSPIDTLAVVRLL